MGDFVSLVSFLKITELGPFCELLFHGKSYLFIVAKYGLRNKLGDFFTNSSGHTSRNGLRGSIVVKLVGPLL
jgi:hypothetical protein